MDFPLFVQIIRFLGATVPTSNDKWDDCVMTLRISKPQLKHCCTEREHQSFVNGREEGFGEREDKFGNIGVEFWVENDVMMVRRSDFFNFRGEEMVRVSLEEVGNDF